MTEYDKENITEILHGKGTWFTADLFRLIAKADGENRVKLFKAFPIEVNAVHVHLTGKTIHEDINLPTSADTHSFPIHDGYLCGRPAPY